MFVHAKNEQPLLTELYQRVRAKYDALDLTPDNMIMALEHCSSRYGLFITSDTNHLLDLLKPFLKDLKQAKIWIISINAMLPENKPSYVADWRGIRLTSNRVQIGYKALRPEIKWATTEMRRHLTMEIRGQKPTPEQERLAFLDKLNHVYALYFTDSKLRTPFVAEQMGISVSTLERKCEKFTNQLPGQLLTRFRLDKAREMVKSTRMHMSAIARQTGFTSSSYFSVRYTEYFGQTPSQTRNQHHKQAS